jgi:hypothetical protein
MMGKGLEEKLQNVKKDQFGAAMCSIEAIVNDLSN